MSDDEHEEPSPVTAFLAPLELGQHRAVMKRLGYDNPHLGLHLGLHESGHGPR